LTKNVFYFKDVCIYVFFRLIHIGRVSGNSFILRLLVEVAL